ncbi:MAG: hypothetical protein ACRD9S_22305 [Pyrinomonadaceae bacterium]
MAPEDHVVGLFGQHLTARVYVTHLLLALRVELINEGPGDTGIQVVSGHAPRDPFYYPPLAIMVLDDDLRLISQLAIPSCRIIGVLQVRIHDYTTVCVIHPSRRPVRHLTVAHRESVVLAPEPRVSLREISPHIMLITLAVRTGRRTAAGPIDVIRRGLGQSHFAHAPQKSRFTEAVAAARQILQGNNPCADFFGGAGLAALDGIADVVGAAGGNAFGAIGESTLGIRMSIPTSVPTSDAPIASPDAYAAISPTSVRINTNGSFVRMVSGSGGASLPRFGNYNPGSLQSRVLQLLHETGHLVITGTSSTLRGIRVGKRINFYPISVLNHLLPLDGSPGDTALSEENTRRVLAACRAQIDALQK